MPEKETGTETDDDGEVRVFCEVYSRIVGYLRPVQNWNVGKQQEFADRVNFEVPEEVRK